MIVYIIYKQILNSIGDIENVEIVECDLNETNAMKFSKLYGLQIPHDLRNRISYAYYCAKVV